MDSGRSMFILPPDCVTRRIDGIVSTLPSYEESIGQYRSDNGVVTGKTAEKQGKCTLGLSPRAYSCLTPYALHYKQSKRTCTTVFIKAILSWRCLGFVPCPLRLRCIALISLWQKWTAINYGRRTTRNPRPPSRASGEP